MLAFLDKIPFGTPRIRKTVFWLLTTFIAYVLIGFFIIPPTIKSIIIDQSTTGLNRQTSIERVAFNPLTLRFEVHGLTVDKREGEGHLLSVGSFTASPGIATIWELAPVIDYLHLRNIAVDITFFGDGKYSISDLFGTRNGKQTEEDTSEGDGTVFPFALYGFEMTNATIVFDDRPHDKKHIISSLDLRVPFTSSFMDLRKEFTQPKFTAVVNGDPVELDGRTLPFDDTLRTEFELGAVDVDLNQYWTYLPMESPLQLVEGRFTSDISLFFERPDAQRINLFLGGGGTLTNLQLAAPGDDKVLSLKKLEFEMEKFSLGDKELVLTNVLFDQPYFKVIRRKDNTINWGGYFPARKEDKEGKDESITPPSKESSPLELDIKKLAIQGGSLDWRDLAVPGGFKRTFRHFEFKGTELNTHGDSKSRFDISIGEKGLIKVSGATTFRPIDANAKVSMTGLSIPGYKPYLDQMLPMIVGSGTAGLEADISFAMRKGTPDLAVNNATLTVNDLALLKPDAKEPSLGFDTLVVAGTTLDLAAKNIEVDEVNITGPMVKLVKDKTGVIDLVPLFKKEEQPAKEVAEELEQGKPWTATVKAVHMTEGKSAFKDFSLKHPADLSIDGLKVDVNNITTRKGATLTYDVSTRWGRRGLIRLNGKAILDTMKSSGRLRLKGVSLRPFDGHLGEHTELLFASGAATADLKYVFSGGKSPKFTVTGNTALTKVQLKDNRGDGEFAGIDAFKLAGIRLANAPYRLSIADIHLDGPRAAIDFDENGRLNIRRAFRIPEPPPVPEKSEEEKTEAKAETKQSAPPEAKSSVFNAIDIGKITMANGRVTFRDASVHPVYMTVISDMKLGIIEIAKTSDARPKIDFSANIGPTPMSITGVINPVITPIYSDLAIAVNGMELVPLSPYTIEHLAYPVEKGRLYADVTFKTKDWELSADNKFFIEQLELGPKDKRPDAPSVPVKFGLALLQDGNGDMELNLPIRGRLDDPDFRIGGIVFKAIASLFVKALASPFTLIGSIFGGGSEDMDFVVFKPGRHQLDQAGMQKMETTIKALKKRERLTLEVDGVIDPVSDKSGLVEVIFEDKLKQQKFNSLSRKERAQTSAEAMVVTPEEYEEFLFDAYKEEPDPDGIKPTTLFMTDRQPIEYMEKFILDRIVVTDEDLSELARRRAGSVKTHIIKRDAALTERVYLLDRSKDKKGKVGVPKHRADLAIK